MLKLSKTAIRELSKMYRAVLMGAMVTLIATGANATTADITINGGTMTDESTSTDYTVSSTDPLTGSVNIDLTDYAKQNDLTILQNTVGDSSSGLVKDVGDLTETVNGLTSGTGTLDVNSATVRGDLTTTGDATISGDLNAGATTVDSLTTTGDATVGSLYTSGKVSAGTLTATGDTTLKGDLQTTGDATISGDLNAGATTVDSLTTGEANLGNTTVNGTLTATGDATVGSISTKKTDGTYGNATLGTTTVKGDLTATGDTTLKGDLQTTGDATISGTLNAGATTVDSLDAGSGEIKTTGTVSANEVYVGDSTTDGYLEVSGTTGKFVILDGSEGGVAANYMMAYEIGSLGTLDVLVSDPSQPDTYRSVFQADTNGNVTNDGTITSGGLITANGGLTVKNGEDFTLGGTAVNAIDTTGVNRNAPGDETTLTTTAAVVNTINNQAQDATYTNTVTNNSNVTANTLNGAIANLDNAIGNRTLTSSNGNINAGMATSLSAGLQAAGNAIGSLNYSSTNYVRAGSDLTTALSTLDNQLYQLNNSYNDLNEEVKDMNKEMKAGFASVAALSGLQPNARAFNDTQISVGVGNYRGQTGFALGGFHYVNDNLMMNVGAAYAGDHSATFRGGLTFGW
jgi:hypothetical protein